MVRERTIKGIIQLFGPIPLLIYSFYVIIMYADQFCIKILRPITLTLAVLLLVSLFCSLIIMIMKLLQKDDENKTILSVASIISYGISVLIGVLIILNTSFMKELELKSWFNEYFLVNPTSQLYLTFISKYNTGSSRENYYHERTLLVHDIVSLLFFVWGILIFLSSRISKQIAEFLSNGFRENIVETVPEDLSVSNDQNDFEKSLSISHSYSKAKSIKEDENKVSQTITQAPVEEHIPEKTIPTPEIEPVPEPEPTLEIVESDKEPENEQKGKSPERNISSKDKSPERNVSTKSPEKATTKKEQEKVTKKDDNAKIASKSQPVNQKSKLKVKKEIVQNKTLNGKSPLGFDMSSSSSDDLGITFGDSSVLDAINESSDSFDALIRDSSPRTEKKFDYSAKRPRTARRRGANLTIDNGSSDLLGSDSSFLANKSPPRSRARTKASPTRTYDSMNEDSLFNHIVNEDY